ncbi:hypothetical protein F4802DRAFT_273219 [Xylaria palmicola]|nr:hypothetical protein F4802DRAFT_273219 [Xylaria palmicola]
MMNISYRVMKEWFEQILEAFDYLFNKECFLLIWFRSLFVSFWRFTMLNIGRVNHVFFTIGFYVFGVTEKTTPLIPCWYQRLYATFGDLFNYMCINYSFYLIFECKRFTF